MKIIKKDLLYLDILVLGNIYGEFLYYEFSYHFFSTHTKIISYGTQKYTRGKLFYYFTLPDLDYENIERAK